MMRILCFFIVVLLLGVGFAWLADRPGDLVLTFAGMQYKVSLMVAATSIVAIVAGVMLELVAGEKHRHLALRLAAAFPCAQTRPWLSITFHRPHCRWCRRWANSTFDDQAG